MATLTTNHQNFTLTKDQALAAFKQNKALATHYSRVLWIFIASSLVFFLFIQLLIKLESKIWSKMVKQRLELYEMDQQNTTMNATSEILAGGAIPTNGYHQRLNSGTEDCLTAFGGPISIPKIPIWQRLIRSFLAFFRKYFLEISIPFIRLSLAELCLVSCYIGFMISILVVETHNIPPTPITPFTVIGIANRAGLLAVASLPFNVLLSNRINLVGQMMGLSFDRIQYLHRWVGRTTLGLAITHGTCKLIQTDTFGDHSFRRFGLGAFIVALFMFCFNTRLMLKKAYETFVSIHIIAIIVLIALIWNHMPREKGYLVATICLWVFDRTFRWTRLILYNGLWRMGNKRSQEIARLRLLSHDTTRLEVYKPNFVYWKPGAYAYISTPGLPFWPQSHPFTIASRPKKSKIVQNSTFSMDKGNTYYNEPNLIFLIRSRNGWTKKLHELAQKTGNPEIPILIDGPYDGAPELHTCFDTVLLFAGGAGISWTLPLLMDLCEKAKMNQSSVRRIIWVCALRHYVNYDWFFEELETIVQTRGNNWIDIRIHYTTDTNDIQNVPTFFKPGRPDIEQIIEEAVNAARGRVFIGVSGPLGPSEEVRRCARLMTSPYAILKGDARGDVVFHMETFGW